MQSANTLVARLALALAASERDVKQLRQDGENLGVLLAWAADGWAAETQRRQRAEESLAVARRLLAEADQLSSEGRP